jgi:peroxin-6
MGLGIPPSYAKTFGCAHSTLSSTQTLSKIRCSVAIVQPVQLTQIFLLAITEASYQLARTNPSLLEEWFCTGEPILRQNATYTFSENAVQTSSDPFRFRLLMAEPVLQGYASVGITEFCISTFGDRDHSWVQLYPSRSSSEFGADSDKDSIEISENFLAGSVLHTMPNDSRPASSLTFIGDDAADSGVLPKLSDGPPPVSSTDLYFSCGVWNGPNLTHAVDHTVYIRTFDLARIGLLNGDWVSSLVHDHEFAVESTYRVVLGCNLSEGIVKISPCLRDSCR